MKVGIVGAGMAGLSCALALQARGAAAAIFEKARGPGGRLAARRLDTPMGTATFDFGAQAITVNDQQFLAVTETWRASGKIERWPDAGLMEWTGTPAMNAVPKHLASSLRLTCSIFVRGMLRDRSRWYFLHDRGRMGPFDAVVIALPAEQAAAMMGLHDLSMARVAVATPSVPCWTVMLALPDSPREQLLIEGHGIIRRAACSTSKPGRTGPQAWTVHAEADWTRRHIDADSGTVRTALRGALSAGLGGAPLDVLAADTHLWRYAFSGSAGQGSLWNAALGIGACGDWLIGSGAQSAWLSGAHLAERMTSA